MHPDARYVENPIATHPGGTSISATATSSRQSNVTEALERTMRASDAHAISSPTIKAVTRIPRPIAYANSPISMTTASATAIGPSSMWARTPIAMRLRCTSRKAGLRMFIRALPSTEA